jgi:hypothetical protein
MQKCTLGSAGKNVEAVGVRTGDKRLEADRYRRNHSKIWRVTSDAELGDDAEHGALPQQRVEAHVDAARQPIGVRHNEVARVRIGEIAGADGSRRADRQRGPFTADNIRAERPFSFGIEYGGGPVR